MQTQPALPHRRKPVQTHARTSRPTLGLKRGSSYNGTHNSGQATSNGKVELGRSEIAQGILGVDEDEGGMASFLNYCATCERQIITPGASILYCSEACRRKDVSRSDCTHDLHSPTSVALSSYFDYPTQDILPQRSPTVLRPASMTFSDVAMDEAPCLLETEHHRPQWEAEHARAFGQYRWAERSSTSSLQPRSRLDRSSTATDLSELPSLVHSPSSSVASTSSTAPTRPRPSRHNKSYSANTSPAVDLVTPYQHTDPAIKPSSIKSSASTITSFRVVEAAGLSYDKQRTARRPSEAQGSLRQLFSHEAMKAPPRDASQLAGLD